MYVDHVKRSRQKSSERKQKTPIRRGGTPARPPRWRKDGCCYFPMKIGLKSLTRQTSPACRNAIPPLACGKIEKNGRICQNSACVRVKSIQDSEFGHVYTHARRFFGSPTFFLFTGNAALIPDARTQKKRPVSLALHFFGEARPVRRFTFLLRFFSIFLRFIDCIPKTIQLILDNWNSLIACPSYESAQRIY